MDGVVTWAKGNHLFVELEDHRASHHPNHICAAIIARIM